MKIIDSAVCLQAIEGHLQIDDLLEQMEDQKVSHAIAAPSDELLTVYNEKANEQMVDLVKRFPDKLSGLAVANPWYGQKAVEILQKYFGKGLCGLYIHPLRQGFLLTEELIHPLIEVCRRFDKPVYSHTGSFECSMPFQLAYLARRFPDVSFIMGHAAWSDFSGYDVFPACQQASNIFVETSCTVKGVIDLLISNIGAERIVFGSAYPRSNPAVEIAKIKRMRLDSEVEKKIFYENALGLWKIKIK